MRLTVPGASWNSSFAASSGSMFILRRAALTARSSTVYFHMSSVARWLVREDDGLSSRKLSSTSVTRSRMKRRPPSASPSISSSTSITSMESTSSSRSKSNSFADSSGTYPIDFADTMMSSYEIRPDRNAFAIETAASS